LVQKAQQLLEGSSAKGFTDDCEQSKTGAAESVPFAGSKWAVSRLSDLGWETPESRHSQYRLRVSAATRLLLVLFVILMA
jgi:hypothetical protein